jgi:hypothetical protein
MGTIIGRRAHPDAEGRLRLAEGDYGKDPRDGNWYGRPPGNHLGSFANHEVTEHADGTISVSPSILISDHRGPVWHGYLERGVWRAC